MKKLIYISIILFSFIACNNKEIPLNEITTRHEMLEFSNYDEYSATLSQLTKMSDQEREEWENLKKFQSFGTIADKIYNSLNPEELTSIDEIYEFVRKNSQYIELVKDVDGELSCVAKEELNVERYIMNKDKMYVVGENVYKLFGETLISSNKSNIAIIYSANDIKEISVDFKVISEKPELYYSSSLSKQKEEQSINNRLKADEKQDFTDVGNNRIVLNISTKEVEVDGGLAGVRNEFVVKNQKRTLGVWINAIRTTSFVIHYSTYDTYNEAEGMKYHYPCFIEMYNESLARFSSHIDQPVVNNPRSYKTKIYKIAECWARNGSGCYVELTN